ncbi:GRP family sugar transporter [Niabella drilacis]|uniref:Glucose uptake protein n=1 Tax=Niabella drilacis (strain DSM 25811 / CCM 8410 / CCUG 62505 / LMG 26954 / E90) TaxID=1285928 RepID=A0A1G6ZMJ8_NIADE|nr:GRP family sugar transporter [Niabella drilacis]SDE03045.1 glucose uptake protein [Niabella drilacis]
MYIVDNYQLAVLFCIVTMLCWGSWANTQKISGKNWRYEFFYWDYVIGMVLFSLLAAFTLGSHGQGGRSFEADLMQAGSANIASALVGGVVFNAANILLSAAIAIAGMAVAFPIGIGLALVIGVLVNYMTLPKGNAALLFTGTVLIIIAVILNSIAYKTKTRHAAVSMKGIMLSVIAGILMAFFYRFIAASMDLNDFIRPEAGKMTPYTASVIFAAGVLGSNFLFNTILIKKPFIGNPGSYAEYFKGRFRLHIPGIVGGGIWGLGNLFNLIAAGKAGPAISYGLGQGATLVAALWGVFVWKEFRGAPAPVFKILFIMFALFIAGLVLIIKAGSG